MSLLYDVNSLEEFLDELIEYFEDRADADGSGDPIEFHGNVEMSLLDKCERIKERITKEKLELK